MVYGSKLALTVNWSAEANTTRADNSYFRNLCKDSLKGLRKGEVIYCFTEEQVKEIERRAAFGINVIVEEDYYRITRESC